MEHLVVGAGDVGRWFADVVGGDLAFADVDRGAAAEAAASLGGDVDDGGDVDLVTVAVPLPAAVDAIEEHAPRAREAVADVTGQMADPLAAMERTAPDRERLSLHPLFAPESAPGNVAVAADDAGPAVERVRTALVDRGNAIVEVTPAEHDAAMRSVQVRAHAAIVAFGLAVDDVPPELETPVYEGMMELLDRVTGGNPRVYADIQATFGGAEDVAEAARRVAEADREEFTELYENAR